MKPITIITMTEMSWDICESSSTTFFIWMIKILWINFVICYILIKILLCICFLTHLGACLLCAKRDSVHLDQLGFYLFYHCSTKQNKTKFFLRLFFYFILLSTNAARKYKGDKVLWEPLPVDWNARRKCYKSLFFLVFLLFFLFVKISLPKKK